MPSPFNIYQGQTPLGAAISNLAQAYFSGPSPLERDQMQAELEYYKARADEARAAAALDQQKFGAPSSIAAAFQQALGAVPEGGSREALVVNALPQLAEAVAATDLSELGNVILALTANAPGVGTQAIDRAGLGAGQDYAKTIGGVREGLANDRTLEGMRQRGAMERLLATPVTTQAGARTDFAPGDPRAAAGPIYGPATESTATGALIQRLAAGDANLSPEALAVAGAMEKAVNPANPRTYDQVRGGILAGMSPEDQRVALLGQSAFGPNQTQVEGGLLAENFANLADLDQYQRQVLGANPTASSLPTPRNYITPDGRQGITHDGLTDAATGERLPQGSQVSTAQVQTASPSDLTTAVQTDLQRQVAASENFTDLLDTVVGIAESDPTLFGTAGNIRRVVQSVAGQARGMASLLGGDLDAELAAARGRLAGTNIDPAYFDPNLTDLDKLASLLAYEAAAVVAGQEGRGLSDRDFREFRAVIGDPTSWFSTQQSFISGLQRLRDLVAQRTARAQTRLGGAAPQAPAAPAGGAPTRIRVDINGNIIQ